MSKGNTIGKALEKLKINRGEDSHLLFENRIFEFPLKQIKVGRG